MFNITTTSIVMSTIEICEVLKTNGIEKQHNNVLRDVDNMMRELSILNEGGVLRLEQTPQSYEGTYIHPQNGQSYLKGFSPGVSAPGLFSLEHH